MHAKPSLCRCHAYQRLLARYLSSQITEDSLRYLIEHQDRSISILFVNDLEARGIAEYVLDPCKGVEDLGDPKRLWVVKRVLCNQPLGRQALLHVGGRE